MRDRLIVSGSVITLCVVAMTGFVASVTATLPFDLLLPVSGFNHRPRTLSGEIVHPRTPAPKAIVAAAPED